MPFVLSRLEPESLRNSWQLSFSSGSGPVVRVVAEGRVYLCEEDAGDSDHGDLEGFSGVLEAFAQGFQGGGMPAGDEGGLVEAFADILSSAPDMALRAHLAGVAGVRGKASEIGYGAAPTQQNRGHPPTKSVDASTRCKTVPCNLRHTHPRGVILGLTQAPCRRRPESGQRPKSGVRESG